MLFFQLIVGLCALSQVLSATPAERAAEMLAQMTTDEKLTMMYDFLNFIALYCIKILCFIFKSV
jgi:hypothetical protein